MATESVVSLRLRVLEEGLGNLTRLIASLDGAGKETQALTDYARQLAAEQARLARDQGLIENFARQKSAVQASKDAMDQAQAEAQRLGRALAQTDEPTKAQTREFEAARQAVGRAKQAYQDQVLQLERSRKALADTGIESDKLADAQARISRAAQEVQGRLAAFASQLQSAAPPAKTLQSTADAADAALRRMGNGGDQAAASTKALGAAADQSTPALKGLQTQVTQVAQAVGSYFALQQAGQMLWDTGKVADGWNDIRAALTNALGPQVDVNRAMQDAVGLSLRTYTSLEATATLYGQLARAGREIGVSQADALRLTETINKAAQVVKTSAGAAEAGVTQLLQGLRSGVVRGDEFNSVMENSPRLAQAMADGLGVTVGQLRNLAEQGQLTTQTVINALQSQAGAIDTEFARLPLTIARSVSELQTRWSELVGTFDQSSGASAQVAGMIEGIANNLDELAEVAARAGAVVVAAMAVQAVTALRAAAAEMIATGAAAKLLRADLDKLGAPVKIVVAVVGLEVGYQIGQLLYENSEYARKLGIGLTAFFENIVNDLRFVKEAGEAIFTDDTVGAAFDRYRERGKEMDAIFSEMWAGASQAPAAIEAASNAAGGALAGLGGAGTAAGGAIAAGAASGAAGLGGVAGKANEADAALSALVASAQAKLPQIGPTIDTQVKKLADLAKTSKDAASKIAAELPAALAKLEGSDLVTVRAKLLAAFSDPQIPAKLLTSITAALGDRAAQSLGVDVPAASSRMTAGFVQAKDGLAVLLQSLPALEARGVNTAVVVGQALAGMVNTAKSQGDLDALTARVDALRAAGQLTETQYIALSASIRTRSAEMADAMDSVADALLKRFGTSLRELETGISASSAEALNGLSDLTRMLDELGVEADTAAPLLTKALDQTLQAATSTKAVEAVIARWEELGRQGKVSGDQMAAGLEVARQKLDELKPGLSSVDEALKTFGLNTRGEMQRTAASLSAAWDKIKYDATVSLDAKREAFDKYAKAAMAANGGVITTEMQVQASMLGVELSAQRAGAAGIAGMHQIRDAAKEATAAVGALNTSLAERNKSVESAFAQDAAKRTGSGTEAGGNTLMSVINTLKGYGLDDAAAQEIAREFVDGRGEVPYMNNPGQRKYGGPGGGTLSSALQAAASQYLYGKDGKGGEMARRDAAANAPAAAPATAPVPAPAPAPAPARVYAVQITLAGRTETISTSSDRDAQVLMGLIKQLETEAARAAGGTS